MCAVLLLCFRMRRKREQNPPKSLLSRDISSDFSSVNDAEKGSTYFGVHLFGYEELVEATNNFDTFKELGDGGFGTVYYGKDKHFLCLLLTRKLANTSKEPLIFLIFRNFRVIL